MFDSKPIDTSMGTNSKLIEDESDSLMNQTMYRVIIGSLLYLSVSRPDIEQSVEICARFQACPRDSHLKAAKWILRYLKKMGDLVLFYTAGDTFDLLVLQMLILLAIKLTRRALQGWLISLDLHLSHGELRNRIQQLFQQLKLSLQQLLHVVHSCYGSSNTWRILV